MPNKNMTKNQLVALAGLLGISISKKMKKAEIISHIEKSSESSLTKLSKEFEGEY